MSMDWQHHAGRLAATVTPRGSQWREPVTAIPRHLFVPRWWDAPTSASFNTWTMYDGASDVEAWMNAAYADTTLVTQVAELHADHAEIGATITGRPTSSSTLPGLAVQMLQHADIYDGADVLDVATGSGYSAALLCRRLGDDAVTSIDVDPYIVEAAAERLADVGQHPKVFTADATGALPGSYDRIVSMVSVRPIPESWLAALRPGGRLVTVIAKTCLIITADKLDNGWAEGRVQWDRAMFMPTRTGGDYPPGLGDMFDTVRDQDGEEVSKGRYPVLKVVDAWELQSMLEVTAPGIEHYFEDDNGRRTAWMLHADGSWARATAVDGELPTVHQGGPRRLWDVLDEIRYQWLVEGSLPLLGAQVHIHPSGRMLLTRGKWRGRID